MDLKNTWPLRISEEVLERAFKILLQTTLRLFSFPKAGRSQEEEEAVVEEEVERENENPRTSKVRKRGGKT